MSKLYDAIMKAQREEAAHKKAKIPEPAPKPQTAGSGKGAYQKAPIFDIRSKITPKELTRKPLVAHKRVSRVTVGKFLAKHDSLMAEQFRKLRSIVTTHDVHEPPRSILVTSCMPGEGKTKVVLNLSAAIAKGLDDSVILIDADLRKKNLSSLLGLGNALGLSDILIGKAGIQEILVPTEIKGLMILPAGSDPSNRADLIASGRMRNLFQQLKEAIKNSYIVIDSTPVVSTSEASVISQIVDGVIVVIMAEKTRRDLVNRELNTINREKILGVVLNCAEFETSHYYKKYYKHYYGNPKH